MAETLDEAIERFRGANLAWARAYFDGKFSTDGQYDDRRLLSSPEEVDCAAAGEEVMRLRAIANGRHLMDTVQHSVVVEKPDAT